MGACPEWILNYLSYIPLCNQPLETCPSYWSCSCAQRKIRLYLSTSCELHPLESRLLVCHGKTPSTTRGLQPAHSQHISLTHIVSKDILVSVRQSITNCFPCYFNSMATICLLFDKCRVKTNNCLWMGWVIVSIVRAYDWYACCIINFQNHISFPYQTIIKHIQAFKIYLLNFSVWRHLSKLFFCSLFT